MPVPDFQTLMRPLLESISDGQEHRVWQNRISIAKILQISPQDQEALLPSGRQTIFANRVAWAKTHLRMAGLVENTSRGAFRLTDRGREVLRNVKGPINLRFLQNQPEYAEARGGGKSSAETNGSEKSRDTQSATPEETIEGSYQFFRGSLARELLLRLKSASPSFFERTVVELLVLMGYGGNRLEQATA